MEEVHLGTRGESLFSVLQLVPLNVVPSRPTPLTVQYAVYASRVGLAHIITGEGYKAPLLLSTFPI